MTRKCTAVFTGALVLLGGFLSPAFTMPRQAAADEAIAAASAASSTGVSIVPRVMQFNGVVTDSLGKPATGTATITFSLYELQEGGAPLWVETQSLAPPK